MVGLLLLLTGVGVTATPSPAGAAPKAVTLQMVEGGGVLQLRGGEPYSLDTPTTITGTEETDTGLLSGLSFSTPKVEIERQITEPIRGTVYIDATFSQVAPGVGTIDSTGKVTLTNKLKVDLHIEVIPQGSQVPLQLGGDCTASPIDLVLTSSDSAPFNGTSVTVSAGNFSVPPVVTGGSCDPIVGNQINEELSGPGHSLSLLLNGNLEIPPDGDCYTVTTLAVDPAGTARLGEEVTLTATTTSDGTDPECVERTANSEAPSGFVDFLQGGVIIGSGEMASDGTTTFSTSSLPAGNTTLTASYRGAFPFIKSTSAPAAFLVTAAPQVTTSLPPFLPLGQTTEFDYTVTNTNLGESLEDVHTNITIRTFTVTPTLERWDGASWVAVPLTTDLPQFIASLPSYDLAPGAERTERLRITAPPAPPSTPGDATVTLEVVPADAPLVRAPNPAVLGSGAKATTFVKTERVAPQFAYFFGSDYAIEPHTVRQGGTLTTYGFFIEPAISGYLPQGHLEFLIDGQVVPVATQLDARPGEEVTRVPATGGTTPGPIAIALPPTISTGTHELTVRYSGDAVFLPGLDTHEFTVAPAAGPSYMCAGEGLPPFYMQGNVQALANLPTSAAPGPLALDNLDISILADRSYLTYSVLSAFLFDDAPTPVGEFGLDGVRFTVNGTELSASGVTRSNSYPFVFMGTPYPAPANEVDHRIALDGEAGTFDLAGAPGDVVPVTLDSIEIDLRNFLSVINVVCNPVDEPALLGEVRVAAVGLTVEASSTPARAGDEVTLTADMVNPAGAGVAEFLDGTDTLGVVPVANGKATLKTDDLDAGDHALKVRVYPQPADGVLTSPVVDFEVLPQYECAAFAEAGHGAVVRLVYMELLNRCPDQAGFDYWKGRLAAGVSPTRFADTIAATPEAVDQVVIDAYQTTLGRNPSATDRVYWRNWLRKNGRYQDLLATLSGSEEFWSLSGKTRAGLVTRVYNRMLNRNPSAADVDYWVGVLLSGQPRSTVMRTIANLREPLGVIVDSSYDEILSLSPNAGERSTAITDLQRTGNRSALYSKLIGDPRFRERAQGFPNPED